MDLRDKGLRDSTEFVVHQIWRDSLGLVGFSIYDDFFELGGSSLAALKILGAVRSQFGIDLSLKTVWECPTVESMSRILRTGGLMPCHSYTLIRLGTDLPIIVCLHPIGGSIIWYSDLVDALAPGITVIGLQAAGLDPHSSPHHDIVPMAEDYLTELLAQYVARDILLIGYSFGGLVAFEMACQLEKMATPPRGLVLLDSVIPTSGDSDLTRADVLARLIWSALGFPPDAKDLPEIKRETLCDQILSAALKYQTLPADYGTDRLRSLIGIYPINAAAACRYSVPEYGGQVHLLKPADAPTFPESDDIWRRQCTGGLTIHNVPGGHDTVITGNNAIPVAGIIEHTWFPPTETSHEDGRVNNGVS